MTGTHGLPAAGLHHIGYWTDDIGASVDKAVALLGAGPFFCAPHVPLGDFRYDGEPAVLDHTAAFGQWGPVILELNLVHEVSPAGLEADLNIRPGAVSHVSWHVPDLGKEGARVTTLGCPLLTTSVGGAVADWFGGGAMFEHAIEIHQPTDGVLGLWSKVHAASIDWDGTDPLRPAFP